MSPTGRALALLAAALVVATALAFEPALGGASWLGLGVLFGLLVVDAGLVFRRGAPQVVRHLPAAIPLGVRSEVRLELRNPTRRTLRLRVMDHHPPRSRVSGIPATLVLPAERRAEVTYDLWPEARGLHDFGPVALRLRSPLGLFERHLLVGRAQAVRCYPNFQAAKGYQLLAHDRRTGEMGIRRRPRRGEGLDFHQLREYRAGDPLRQIDWKATARLRRAISREYQDERDQQIVFLLDCGRRLHTRDGERSHFDAALDAVLLMSHVALRQGDAVGLMTFAGERRWLAPRKGVAQVNTLLGAVHDLESGPRAADFVSAARELVTRVPKRALVVLMSNVRDDDATELAASLRLLSRRHVVLLASLRESVLGETLRRPVRDRGDALRTASVLAYLEQRRRALHRLERGGALLLDSEPAELSVALVNRYLAVKAAGIL